MPLLLLLRLLVLPVPPPPLTQAMTARALERGTAESNAHTSSWWSEFVPIRRVTDEEVEEMQVGVTSERRDRGGRGEGAEGQGC
jgi:hypothetical protein